MTWGCTPDRARSHSNSMSPIPASAAMTVTSGLEAQAVCSKTDGCVVLIRKGVGQLNEHDGSGEMVETSCGVISAVGK